MSYTDCREWTIRNGTAIEWIITMCVCHEYLVNHRENILDTSIRIHLKYLRKINSFPFLSLKPKSCYDDSAILCISEGIVLNPLGMAIFFNQVIYKVWFQVICFTELFYLQFTYFLLTVIVNDSIAHHSWFYALSSIFVSCHDYEEAI